ncbi:MAG: hypothetical protein PHQ23_03900 [Candidatus Wallbacteria bacterium]|nr:hypothetical protein [Candidatus Wallbacteria bacterium]
MADQEIKDKHSKILGKIKERSDGKFELRDNHSCVKGIYDPVRNETRDKHSKMIGKGNLLASLVTDKK